MGVLEASKIFDVRRATLKGYVNSRGKKAEALVAMRMGRKPVLAVRTED
jgi:hypothetical protein